MDNPTNIPPRYYVETDDPDEPGEFRDFDEIGVPDLTDEDKEAIRKLKPGEQTELPNSEHRDFYTITRARTVRVEITIDVDCLDENDPADIVDKALDRGTLQDEINDPDYHEYANALTVRSAVVTSTETIT